MAREIEQEVSSLLRPTDDEIGWYQRVTALDRSEAVPVLVSILNDEQEKQYTRRQAALILSLLGDKRAISALTQALNAGDRILRGQAAQALGRFEGLEHSVIQQLIQGLQDEDYFMRECSAKALGQLRLPEALPALERMSATDNASNNREVAQKAIGAIKGVTVPDD